MTKRNRKKTCESMFETHEKESLQITLSEGLTELKQFGVETYYLSLAPQFWKKGRGGGEGGGVSVG